MDIIAFPQCIGSDGDLVVGRGFFLSAVCEPLLQEGDDGQVTNTRTTTKTAKATNTDKKNTHNIKKHPKAGYATGLSAEAVRVSVRE